MAKIRISLLVLLIFLLAPEPAKEGALSGLKLWLFTIFPTLFPFIFITEIIKRIGTIPIITRLIYPVAGRFLKLSPYGTYPFILGLLCGFPMGAKTACDMIADNQITADEGKYLLTFTNMLSPGFIIGYYCNNVLNGLYSPIIILAIIYLSQLLTCLIFKITVFRHCSFNTDNTSVRRKNTTSQNDISLDKILSATFTNIYRISGYIIIFSIICEYVNLLPANLYIKSFLTSICEVTSGTNILSASDIPSKYKFIIGNAAITFGGLSGIFQTHSIIKEHMDGTKIYVCSRITASAIAVVLSTCIIY